MDAQIQRLVDKTWKKYLELPKGARLTIGIGGIPGSGKTTLATTVADRLEALAKEEDPSRGGITALAVPMDGFHYTRQALSAMPDPETAHARRGAAFTFDADRYLDLITDLKKNESAIWAPTFDHAVKDPRERDLMIGSETRIVLVEGLYVALDEPIWRDAAKLYDELWFVEVDLDVARKRLRERHLRAGIVQTLEDGDKRAMENDLVNGKQILDKRLPITEVLQSREDQDWVHE